MARAPKLRGEPASSGSGDAPRHMRHDWAVLAVVWVACAVYAGAGLNRDWVSHDAGALAQSAERVLLGQVPHRDFGELYTGGLTYLNALAFRIFGENFFSLRIPLFLFFLGWVPAVYRVARRFAAPMAAGMVTLLAAAWSVPNYPEAMPSWYNLFFATWGMLALVRYTETERRRWLWIAGLCGGLSFLVKITGLYFIAAGLLFLTYREQRLAAEDSASGRKGGWMYRAFVSACLLGFVAAVLKMVHGRPGGYGLFYFVLPSACVAAALAWGEWRAAGGWSGPRFRRLLGAGLPFAGGALAPVVIFLAGYARAGGLRAWFEGTFVLPTTRYHWAALSAPSPLTMTGLAPMAAAVLLAYFGRGILGRWTGAVVIAGLAGLLEAAHRSLGAYVVVGLSLPALAPLPALGLAAFCLAGGGLDREAKRQQVFLAVTVAAVCSLIEFPYAAPIYFCYAAPLVILACVALVSTTKQPDRSSLGAVVIFYLAFAVWLRTPGYFTVLRSAPGEAVSFRKLDLPRAGGLVVKAEQAEEYDGLVRLIQTHARGEYIYAGPDSPEVYFLSGYRNPTGTLFDFLDPDFADSARRTQRLLAAVASHDVNVVALKGDAKPSGPVPAEFEAGLKARYPHASRAGEFEVRWK
ncbi:MAG TPA: glycosyltransferase family 39 protein [Candidatus Acidoferrales bacterium]|nr:glycosyltransferase family 39 protein [Candidatus Acidoferrales bacterium]